MTDTPPKPKPNADDGSSPFRRSWWSPSSVGGTGRRGDARLVGKWLSISEQGLLGLDLDDLVDPGWAASLVQVGSHYFMWKVEDDQLVVNAEANEITIWPKRMLEHLFGLLTGDELQLTPPVRRLFIVRLTPDEIDFSSLDLARAPKTEKLDSFLKMMAEEAKSPIELRLIRDQGE